MRLRWCRQLGKEVLMPRRRGHSAHAQVTTRACHTGGVPNTRQIASLCAAAQHAMASSSGVMLLHNPAASMNKTNHHDPLAISTALTLSSGV